PIRQPPHPPRSGVRLLPLSRSGSIPQGDVILGFTWAADPSAKRPLVTSGQVSASQRIPLRTREAHLPSAPCSSCGSARTLGLGRSEIAASAGFPDQANKYPDGPI